MPSLTVVGPGRHGTAIAQLFAAHGVDITLYHHRRHKAEQSARAVTAVSRNARVEIAPTLEAAADAAEVVAITTLWGPPQRQVIGSLGDRLIGKILLDVSNPLDMTPTGIELRRPSEGSAGQFFSTLLPDGARHVKAFSNLATVALSAAADSEPPAVLAHLADTPETALRVRPLLSRTGWRPFYVGDISRSAEMEVGGRFNTVSGRLGRTVLDELEFTREFGSEQLPEMRPAE